MRIVALVIFIYCLYLFLKYLLKLYLNYINRKKPRDASGRPRFRSKKIDLNKIEEADFEEIKTPKPKQ
jgi:hypothetical protein